MPKVEGSTEPSMGLRVTVEKHDTVSLLDELAIIYSSAFQSVVCGLRSAVSESWGVVVRLIKTYISKPHPSQLCSLLSGAEAQEAAF